MRLLSAYAGDGVSPHTLFVQFGEGLIGQCALDKRQRLVSDIPTDEWNDIRVDITPREYVLSRTPDKT